METEHGSHVDTTRTRGSKGSAGGDVKTTTTGVGGYTDKRTDNGSTYDVEAANDKSYKEALDKAMQMLDKIEDAEDRKSMRAKISKELESVEANIEKTKADTKKTKKDLENYDEDRELRNEKTKAETEKSKAEIEKLKRQGKWDEEDRELDKAKKLNDAREAMEEGVSKAKELMGEGMDTVQKQWEELRKRLNI